MKRKIATLGETDITVHPAAGILLLLGLLTRWRALLIFPRVFGLLGIQISQPVADICTLALCIAMMSGILRQLKAREANAG